MTYHEFLHIRNGSSSTIAEIALASDSSCKVGFHLHKIPFPTEIIGLHLSATGSSNTDALPPADTKARIWLMTRHIETYLPDFIIPGSDTKLVNAGNNYALQIGNDSTLQLNSSAPGGDYVLDFFYVNPIVITQPDYIWVGIVAQSDGGGRFRGSYTNNNPKGITDLEYTGSKPTNASILSRSLPYQISYSSLQAASNHLANINVALITQQPNQDIEYLRPVRLS